MAASNFPTHVFTALPHHPAVLQAVRMCLSPHVREHPEMIAALKVPLIHGLLHVATCAVVPDGVSTRVGEAASNLDVGM